MARIDPPPLHTAIVGNRGLPTKEMGDFMQSLWRKGRGIDAPVIADSTAATVEDLVVDFNALLAALRESGAIR